MGGALVILIRPLFAGNTTSLVSSSSVSAADLRQRHQVINAIPMTTTPPLTLPAMTGTLGPQEPQSIGFEVAGELMVELAAEKLVVDGLVETLELADVLLPTAVEEGN